MKRIEKNSDLILDIDDSMDQITVIWQGRSTERDPSQFLNPIFREISDQGKNIVFDFQELEYMNSSTLTPIIKMLELVKIKQGKLLITYAKNLKWQLMSFSALEVFKTSDNKIDIVGK